MAKICVPVCVSRASELADAVSRASEVADVIELRLDYLSDFELNHAGDEIRKILSSRERPIILTLRPAEYGGARPISADDRLFFRVHHPYQPDFWDLEVDLALILQQPQREGSDVNEIVGQEVCPWNRTICSFHDFVGIPSDLDQIYERMAGTKSQILKIAVQADDAVDCLPLFKLLERARVEGREMIAIGMGEAGVMTRILGPSRGSFLTYASLDGDSGNAPGQLTAQELRDVYRIDQIDLHTQVIGIMGRPVSHSLSPRIHNAAFGAGGLNAVYLPFEVRDALQFIRRMAHPKTRELDWKLGGLSVTAPHKSTVMQALDWIEPAAKEIGAVNTIVARDDQLRGYNTDAAGFISSLRNVFGSLKGARCAIIGAGGAARACSWALSEQGADVTILARDIKKAQSLADRFGAKCRELSGSAYGDFDVVVNATPLGTRGQLENETPATAEQLSEVRLAYDLVYNPIETRFIREARAAGCDVLGGIEMLLAQAIEQFKLWTGRDPDIEVMRTAALRGLSRKA
ncbi:MAG TPA: shikimate dehydrogenase [Blastocatellia bacterium]|nr:shikimate dehydrogenase [Blastocatellia bacterium]